MSDKKQALMENKIEVAAQGYFEKYRGPIELLETTPLAKIRSLTPFDIYAVGKQLEAFDLMVEFAEADGSLGDLGALPRVAHDIIPVGYGTSPMSMVATIQPVDEEDGLVYYKNVKAVDTAGNMTAGDTIASGEAGFEKVPEGYAAGEQTETIGTGNDILLNFSTTLTYLPVRPFSVSVTATIGTATVTAVDDGNGNLIGAGVVSDATSAINYATGAITITFTAEPDDTTLVNATYQQNLESAVDIREINYELTTKSIKSKVFALKGIVGFLKSYSVKKRFGTLAETEMGVDLTNAINAEVFGDMIKKMAAAAVGNTNWSKTIPENVSEFEHRLSLKFAISAAESVLVSNAGRGTVSFMIAGTTGATYLRDLTGFVKLYDGNNVTGAHLLGTLDGVPVIRVPHQAILDANTILLGFKGVSPFEAAAAFTPFMPLTVTSMLPTDNPLTSQKAAAVWGGVDVLVANFITKLTLT